MFGTILEIVKNITGIGNTRARRAEKAEERDIEAARKETRKQLERQLRDVHNQINRRIENHKPIGDLVIQRDVLRDRLKDLQ